VAHFDRFFTNLNAVLSALVSPEGNANCYYVFTPDPTVTDLEGKLRAGNCQVPIVPTGRPGNVCHETFEVIKLLGDTVLAAGFLWVDESGSWSGCNLELTRTGPKVQVHLCRNSKLSKIWVNQRNMGDKFQLLDLSQCPGVDVCKHALPDSIQLSPQPSQVPVSSRSGRRDAAQGSTPQSQAAPEASPDVMDGDWLLL